MFLKIYIFFIISKSLNFYFTNINHSGYVLISLIIIVFERNYRNVSTPVLRAQPLFPNYFRYLGCV